MSNLATLTSLLTHGDQRISRPVLYARQNKTTFDFSLGYGCLTQLAFYEDAVFFEWPALAALLPLAQRQLRAAAGSAATDGDTQPTESSKQLDETVQALCKSPVTQSLIKNPLLILIKKSIPTPALYLLVIDQEEIHILEKQDYQILMQQDFSVLKPLIEHVKDCQSEATFSIQDYQLVSPAEVEETRKIHAYSRAAIEGFDAKIAHLDHWTQFLIKLFSCVRTDEAGNVLGIDQQGRQRVLTEAFGSTAEMSKDFLPHVKHAGNLFISTIDSSGKKQILMVQRSDREGHNPLLSLLGGFADDSENRSIQDIVKRSKTAAIRHAIDKLFSWNADQIAIKACFSNATFQLIATDIVDTLYPATVLPSNEELAAISPYLPENIKDFYAIQTLASTELTLACSCTFEASVDYETFHNIQRLLITDWQQSPSYSHIKWDELYEPVIVDVEEGKITYFAREAARPVELSAHQVADWKYKHEFYTLLNTLGLIDSNPATLLSITQQTIDRISATIATGIFPAETAGLPAGAVYAIWRMNAALNLLGFSRRPYMGLEKLAGIYGISPGVLTLVHTAINDAWEKQASVMIQTISDRMSREGTQYTGTFSGFAQTKALALPAPAGTTLTGAAAEQAIREARTQAWGDFASSSVTQIIVKHYKQTDHGGLAHLTLQDSSLRATILTEMESHSFDAIRQNAFLRLSTLFSCNTPIENEEMLDALARFALNTTGDGFIFDLTSDCKIMMTPVFVLITKDGKSVVDLCDQTTATQKGWQILGEFAELRYLLDLYNVELKAWFKREYEHKFLNSLVATLRHANQVTQTSCSLSITVDMSGKMGADGRTRYSLDECQTELEKLFHGKKVSIELTESIYRMELERDVTVKLSGCPLSQLLPMLRKELGILSLPPKSPKFSIEKTKNYAREGHQEFLNNLCEGKAENLSGLHTLLNLVNTEYSENSGYGRVDPLEKINALLAALNDLVFLRGSIITANAHLNNRLCEALLSLQYNTYKHISCPEHLKSAIAILLRHYAKEKVNVNSSFHQYLPRVANFPALLPSPALQAKLSEDPSMIVPLMAASPVTIPAIPAPAATKQAAAAQVPEPAVKNTALELPSHYSANTKEAASQLNKGCDEYKKDSPSIASDHFIKALNSIIKAYKQITTDTPKDETKTIQELMINIHWSLSSCYLKMIEKGYGNSDKYKKLAWNHLNHSIQYERDFFRKVEQKRQTRFKEMKAKYPALEAQRPVTDFFRQTADGASAQQDAKHAKPDTDYRIS